jgi:hypothetical protein
VDDPSVFNSGRDEGLISLSPEEQNGTLFGMLYTIAVILVVLWLLGLVGHIAGGLIHLLLVIAIILVVVNLVTGRRGP